MCCARVCGVLGAGREKAGDTIKYGVGLRLHVTVGDLLEQGITNNYFIITLQLKYIYTVVPLL